MWWNGNGTPAIDKRQIHTHTHTLAWYATLRLNFFIFLYTYEQRKEIISFWTLSFVSLIKWHLCAPAPHIWFAIIVWRGGGGSPLSMRTRSYTQRRTDTHTIQTFFGLRVCVWGMCPVVFFTSYMKLVRLGAVRASNCKTYAFIYIYMKMLYISMHAVIITHRISYTKIIIINNLF